MNFEMIFDAAKMNRIIFGSMIRNWRIEQGWTQYTAGNWAKEAGFSTVSYGNWSVLDGNWSVIESGKSGELRFASFLQFEELFHRLYVKDYGVIADPLTKEQVEGSQPICDMDGRPWDAIDLTSCYLGRKDVPPELDRPLAPRLSDKALKALCSHWRDQVREHANRAANRSEALRLLMAFVTEQHEQEFMELLMGFNYSHENLAKLWIHTNRYYPDQWIDEWCTMPCLDNG